ncbi:MAG: nucleotidyl transferase, partial [Tissierellia bacterium]|nr:nucleotidyl transferase [Tissierellia bacterium]
MIKIKAVIMSGGMGTRLRPLTCHLPKPMVPIFNKPNMEYIIELLRDFGIEDIAITLHYLPEKIMDYFGNGEKFNVNLKYYIEDKPLGTGGSVKNTGEFLDDTFIVISGDAFTDIDLKKAWEFHKEKKSKATLALKRENIPLEYGVVIVDDNGKIVKFLEKPSWGEVFSDTINTGIYILEPSVLDYYKIGENFDFSKDLFPKLLEDNVPLYGYVMNEYWCDVGDYDSYIETHRDVFVDSNKYYLLNRGGKDGIWFGKNTLIERGAEINPPVFIGDNTIVKSGANIESYTVIGNNCTIGENTSIKKSIIWDNVKIANNCEIRKAVVCNNVFINSRSRIFEGSVLGSHSIVESYATVKPNIKIWPYKKVGEKIILKENLIWNEKSSKKLFGDRNIQGIFNKNIDLETLNNLGAALATAINPSGNYIISCDEYNLSESLKSSIISGILSVGAQIIDIQKTNLPILRFGIKYFNGDGGIFIGSDGKNRDKIFIEILDHSASNIDKNLKRKIENLLSIEDFHRVSGDNIQDIVSVYNFSSIYLREGKRQLKNIGEIQREKPKIIISSPSRDISLLVEKYLQNLGCRVEITSYNMVEKEEGIHNIVLDKNGDLGIVYLDNGERLIISDGFNTISGEKYYLLNMLIGF